MGGPASGLIIYRLGGEALPPPPELGSEGVEFVQLRWTDVDPAQGGETFQLDMDEEAIRALRHDPQENIVPTAPERGGGVIREVYEEAFDGDIDTVWPDEGFLCSEVRFAGWCVEGYSFASTININLGGFFLLDRVRIISGLETPGSIAKTFRISISPEARRGGSVLGPMRPFLMEIRDNRKQYRDVQIPPQERVTFLQVAMSEHSEVWEVAEVEVYARGFVDKSTYVSNIFDFGTPAAWGELRWSGRQEPGAKVFIQTRSGADNDPNRYWRYTGRGDEKVEVTRSTYEGIKFGEQAGTTYDRDNWTFFSAPYEFADSLGALVVSLSPRRYLQFKVDFIPAEDAGGEVEFVEVRASVPPAASTLVGEIDPVQVEVGERSRFTYALKPTIKDDDTGFDRLVLTSSSSRIFAVDSVRIDNEVVPFEVEALEEHRFEVSFPGLQQEDSKALVEVVFEAQVLRFGATFNARVYDSTRPLEVLQGVDPGDATDRLAGNRVSVMTAVDTGSLLQAGVAPGAFTPNGDGVNDVVRVSYDLFERLGPVAVSVEIRDLAGRLVRQVYAGEDPIGHHERVWNGTDDAGGLVPPGMYMYRVSTEANEGKVDEIGMVNVVY